VLRSTERPALHFAGVSLRFSQKPALDFAPPILQAGGRQPDGRDNAGLAGVTEESPGSTG